VAVVKFKDETQAYAAVRDKIRSGARSLGARASIDPFKGREVLPRGALGGVSLGASGAGQPSLEAWLAGAFLELDPAAQNELTRMVRAFIAQGVCPDATGRMFDWMPEARASGVNPYMQVGKSGAAVPSYELFPFIASRACGIDVPPVTVSRIVIPGFYPPVRNGGQPSPSPSPVNPVPGPFPGDGGGSAPPQPLPGRPAEGTGVPWFVWLGGGIAVVKAFFGR
jgi:hypothetical protein